MVKSVHRVRVHIASCFLIMVTMLLVGCNPTPAEPTAAPVVAVKQLVTVEIPPTLNAAERQATRLAMPTTPTTPPPTPTPTETPYVGVFLGEAQPDSENVAPIIESLPTESSLANATDCLIVPDTAFGQGWRSNPNVTRSLGCPIQERFGFAGDVQVFERGVMYRRSETNEVWAVRPGSLEAGEYWYISQPPVVTAAGLVAPPGLRVPSDVFGAIWLSDNNISGGLGYAVTPEQVADLNIQRYEGGTLFLDVTVGQVFALLVNGDAFGPY